MTNRKDRDVVDVEFTWSPSGGMTEAGQGADRSGVRLQKALAAAGVASRRACEVLIGRGRVAVNGETVFELGTRIDPETDEVRVDGVVVQLDQTKRYFVLNKPRGVVSTMADEHGRPDLTEFTSQVEERIYNVGRLDTDTSGLLILTNDGALANELAHPRFEVQKTYVAKVKGVMTPATLQRLKDGIELEDGPISADAAKILQAGQSSSHSLVEITLHSGKNRIVRRMLDHVGHPVVELVRRQFGPLHLGSLGLGELRELSAAERGALLTASEADAPNGKRAVTAGRPGDGRGAKGMRGIASPHQRTVPSKQQKTKNGKPQQRKSKPQRGKKA